MNTTSTNRNNAFAAHMPVKLTIKTAGLLLLLGGLSVQGHAAPCTDATGTSLKPHATTANSSTLKPKVEAAPDYYQSSDNPSRAD